jgi:putative transposase
MKLVKKIKIKINKECKEYLDFASERCRLIYNFALHDKIEAYEKDKTNISIYELKKQLPKIKEEYPEYKMFIINV